MADRRNPYEQYRKPHDGQSVWGGMINNPHHPDIQKPYSGDWQENVWNKPRGSEGGPYPTGPSGGSSVPRKPKPSPMKPAGGMELPIPRIGAMQ